MTTLTTYPPGLITPYQMHSLLKQVHRPNLSYKSFDDSLVWHLMGGRAPAVNFQSGVSVQAIRGLLPGWAVLDQQGATQDGVTFNDAIGDPIEIDATMLVHGATPLERSRVVDDWLSSWDPKRTGEFSATTLRKGKWWGDTRWFKTPTDEVPNPDRLVQSFTWVGRIDAGFWQSQPSVDQFPPVGSPLTTGQGQGFIALSNYGTEDAFGRHLCYGPGTFGVGDGPGSTNLVEFGPLLDGQIGMLTTLPRLRGVVDLSPNQPAQQLDLLQEFIKAIVTLATNNNVPPLLQAFESLFGILPPQGPMYSLLKGRFSNPIPRKPTGQPPVISHIPVKITGGSSASRIVSAVTPLRRWPL